MTDRKRAAATRRQREQLPPPTPLIPETQPGVDEVMATRVGNWIETEQRDQDHRAQLWRRARRQLAQHAPDIRRALLFECWCPGLANDDGNGVAQATAA